MKLLINRKGAAVYLVMLAAAVAAASVRGGPVTFAPLYALLLLVPVAVGYIFLNYKFLRIFQEIEVHRVVRGEDHTFRAVIENEGLLPIHRMRLLLFDDRCDIYEIENGQEISLGAREKRELTSGISCRYAGSYNVGIRAVGFSDPFFMFDAELKVPYTFRAVVNPPITDLAHAALDLENPLFSLGLKSRELLEETPGSDMRVYRPGDALSAVNWKVSARLSDLMVRVPDKMEKRTVTILMQAAFAPESPEDIGYLRRRDYFLELIVSAAWHFAEAGIPVRLIYPAGGIHEVVVDSHRSFTEFYGRAADGIFYSSKEEYEEMQELAEGRGIRYDGGVFVLIREDPGPGEDHLVIGG